MRDVMQVVGVEDEHRDGPGLAFIAEDLVHDVGVLIAQKDAEDHIGGFGNAHNRREFAIDIAAPYPAMASTFTTPFGMTAVLSPGSIRSCADLKATSHGRFMRCALYAN